MKIKYWTIGLLLLIPNLVLAGGVPDYRKLERVPNSNLWQDFVLKEGSITLNASQLPPGSTNYLAIDGSNASTNIDISTYRFTTGGMGTFGTFGSGEQGIIAYSGGASGAAALNGLSTTDSAGVYASSDEGKAGEFLKYSSGTSVHPAVNISLLGDTDTSACLYLYHEGLGDAITIHNKFSEILSINNTGVLGWWYYPYGVVDTNLYRDYADHLKTDDHFEALSIYASTGVFTSTVTASYVQSTCTYSQDSGLFDGYNYDHFASTSDVLSATTTIAGDLAGEIADRIAEDNLISDATGELDLTKLDSSSATLTYLGINEKADDSDLLDGIDSADMFIHYDSTATHNLQGNNMVDIGSATFVDCGEIYDEANVLNLDSCSHMDFLLDSDNTENAGTVYYRFYERSGANYNEVAYIRGDGIMQCDTYFTSPYAKLTNYGDGVQLGGLAQARIGYETAGNNHLVISVLNTGGQDATGLCFLASSADKAVDKGIATQVNPFFGVKQSAVAKYAYMQANNSYAVFGSTCAAGQTMYGVKIPSNTWVEGAEEITNTADHQLRLTHTDGADETDFFTDSDGDLHIEATGWDYMFGNISDTEANTVHIVDGGSDNKPGVLVLYTDAGVPYYLWVDTSGSLRGHSSFPADDDTDGVEIADLTP